MLGNVWTVSIAAALFAALGAVEVAHAQTVLVVRGDSRTHRAVARATDEALRDATGSSARRVDVTLDDLALAAGCDGLPAEPACVASIMRGAGAELLAVEYLRPTEEGYWVRVELLSPSGERMRTVEAHCAPDACDRAIADAWAGSPLVRASTGRPMREDIARHAIAPEVVPSPRQWSIRASTFWLGGAALAGLGSIIAGGFAVDAGARVGRLASDRRPDAGQLTVAVVQRDVSTGVSVGFACVGAGLAIVGAITLVGDSDVRVVAIPLADGGAFSFTGAF